MKLQALNVEKKSFLLLLRVVLCIWDNVSMGTLAGPLPGPYTVTMATGQTGTVRKQRSQAKVEGDNRFQVESSLLGLLLELHLTDLGPDSSSATVQTCLS